ncbi:hypothetical protein [Desulfuribacillus alkaliarsenatis]|uniref:Uncharacterized protein n=1 Tax=Desulfuribacillus alkaliarsenatis TaxID=766136 RepID=A0A1E5G0X9_9FIRM|nr:hypothetical protein [Desulfuribacillus alkaliarsenatis]OEF96567.1 hypothetical protein BHF68_07935 [Desulfuribacillus alkaliarsenatis]
MKITTNFIQTQLVFLVRWYINHKGIEANPGQWSDFSRWEEIALEAVKELYKDELSDSDQTYRLTLQRAIEDYFATEVAPVQSDEHSFVEKLIVTYNEMLTLKPTGQ